MSINGFDDRGKIFLLVIIDDVGFKEVGDKKIMIYSFWLCLMNDFKNKVFMLELN